MFKKLIYLASPYSHSDPNVVTQRYIDTVKATAKLIDQGHLIFSPIVHSHVVAEFVGFSPFNPPEGEMSQWMKYDLAMIDKADEVWVLLLEGWSTSRGVDSEIRYAMKQGIPRRYVRPLADGTLDIGKLHGFGSDEAWALIPSEIVAVPAKTTDQADGFGEAEKQRIDEALDAAVYGFGDYEICVGVPFEPATCTVDKFIKDSRTIIGLTGHARSGKDTAGQYLVENHGFTRIGLADGVREALAAFDPDISIVSSNGLYPYKLSYLLGKNTWDELKTDCNTVREYLQRMGTEVGRNIFGENCWIDIAQRKIEALGPDAKVVITDVRFPNEAEWVRSLGGEVWVIERAGVGPVNDHASDQRLSPEYIDQILPNVGTLELFYSMIESSLILSAQLKGQTANV